MKENHNCSHENDFKWVKETLELLVVSIRGSLDPKDDKDKGVLNRLRSVEIKLKIYNSILLLVLVATITAMVKIIWQ